MIGGATGKSDRPPSASPRVCGELRFRREGDRLCVDRVTPVMWFPRHALECARGEPDVGLSFDGTHVTLHAPNGRWVWRLTGRSTHQSANPNAEPYDMLEGVWPD